MKGGPQGRGDRIVVTGVGAVSAFGWSAGELWQGLLGGGTRIRRAREFGTRRQRAQGAGAGPRARSGWLPSGFRACTRTCRRVG